MSNAFAEICDVLFNGRRAIREPRSVGEVTIPALIRRKRSYVRYGGKLYRFDVKEMEITSVREKA